MDLALQVAALGLVGTLVAAVYNARQEQVRRRQSAELEFLRIQIGELYGPLAGLLQQRKSIFEVSLAAFPSDGEKQLRNQWSNTDWDAWHFLVDRYLLDLDSQIVGIINTKTHLLENAQIPIYLEQLIKHIAQQDSLYSLSREKQLIKDAGHFFVPYPQQIVEEVKSSLARLRDRHQGLLRSAR
ncbi:MAG: hypothetical protein ACK6AD_13990 [Cyanobacteriota bacterium]|jgi:hypothetical protein